MRFLLTPASGGVSCFRKASHSGVSSGWSCMGTGPRSLIGMNSTGGGGARTTGGGDVWMIGGGARTTGDGGARITGGGDRVALIGDNVGVTGALVGGANVSRN